MEHDLQEQACWLLLTYESGLSTRVINDIVVAWCQQLGRTLQAFFSPLLQKSAALHQEKSGLPSLPGQLSLFAAPGE